MYNLPCGVQHTYKILRNSSTATNNLRIFGKEWKNVRGISAWNKFVERFLGFINPRIVSNVSKFVAKFESAKKFGIPYKFLHFW